MEDLQPISGPPDRDLHLNQISRHLSMEFSSTWRLSRAAWERPGWGLGDTSREGAISVSHGKDSRTGQFPHPL